MACSLPNATIIRAPGAAVPQTGMGFPCWRTAWSEKSEPRATAARKPSMASYVATPWLRRNSLPAGLGFAACGLFRSGLGRGFPAVEECVHLGGKLGAKAGDL